MGVDRSSQAVAKELTKSQTLMRRWSARHRWVDRAGAWDVHLDQVRQEAFEQQIVQMSERHAAIAVAGLNVVTRKLVGDDMGVKALDPNTLDPQDVARFASTFSALEREARGLGATSEFAELAAVPVETLIDLGDEEDLEKVIALAEWVGGKVGTDDR